MAHPQKCSCGFGCGTGTRRGLGLKLASAARSFEAVVGRVPNGFCCPLCLRELAQGCATRAHYPAESVAGKRSTLLCKACNSFMGTALEADAHRHFSGAKTEVRISTSSLGPMRAILELDGPVGEPGSVISMRLAKGVGAAAFDQFKADLEGDRKLRLTIQGTVPNRVRLAVLSWAFLAAFAHYGYAFALEPAQRRVRTALLAPHESDLPPTMVLWPSDAPELSPGHPAFVVAFREHPLGVRLLGLAFHFGRAVGVLPLADDLDCRGYRRLEEINFSNQPSWTIQVPPIEALIPGGADVSFESASRLVTGPHVVVGVAPDVAAFELRDHQLTPRRRRPPRANLRVPDEPPNELPHHLSRSDWERMIPPTEVMDRYATDLLEVAVKGRDPQALEDIAEQDVLGEINRVRSYFLPGARPEILRRGQLIIRSERELAWHWASIFWPDGSRDDIGAFFTRAALIEAVDRRTAARLS